MMADIGLIDVDGHNFPNIPLMKISAWHKSQGDSVEWYDPMFSDEKDIVYMSKVFSFTDDYMYPIRAKKIVKGGSGYCISLVDGKEVKMEVSVGDKVLTSKYAGTEVKVDGEEYKIVSQSDILAKVVD